MSSLLTTQWQLSFPTMQASRAQLAAEYSSWKGAFPELVWQRYVYPGPAGTVGLSNSSIPR